MSPGPQPNSHHLARLASKVDGRARATFEGLLREIPLGETGAARFVRYLENVSSPSAVLGQMAAAPHCARLFLQVVATSKQLSDLVVQNPELGDMVLSPESLSAPMTVDGLVEEGRRLLGHAASYPHQLDRIRFLKQKYTLQTAALDLGDLLGQEEVWARLSMLAEGVLLLTREVVWKRVAPETEQCPVALLGMGKFGGDELNYSSDLDLVFVVDDDLAVDDEKTVRKFAEIFRGALADRMGRGDLYRVDLRLRPFGTQGPIFSRMRVLESYYENYAEAWEHQAMIRSKIVGEVGEIGGRWESLRERAVFRGQRGAWILDNMEAMRRKIEAHCEDDDLKRGPGGIRDVEFQVQAMQMIYGGGHESLRGRSTLAMLRELDRLRLVPAETVRDLDESYQFLRKLEHRCQILTGLQTHKLPSDVEGRDVVVRAMGFRTMHALTNALESHRVRNRKWYESVFHRRGRASEVGDEFGIWFDGMPGGEKFAESVRENASSLARVTKVLAEAPALVPSLRTSVALTEQVLTGEVEEGGDEVSRFEGAGLKPDELARSARNGWLAGLLRWVLVPGVDLGAVLARHMDGFVERAFGDVPGVSGVVALGSYGAEDLTPASDGDVVVFLDEEADRERAEKALRERLSALAAAKSAGSPLAVDLRLRPEGRSGRLGVTLGAFRRYEKTSMETWERFALGRSRLVFGDVSVKRIVDGAAFGAPLDDQGLDELVAMKGRIESERVSPKVRSRHLKLGNGGMDDVVWLVQLWFMRHPWLSGETERAHTLDRVRALEDAKILTVVEREALEQAWRFLYELRVRLFLTGVVDDVLPENPDRLDKLGATLGAGDANRLLKRFEETTGTVRAMFEDNVRRMRA